MSDLYDKAERPDEVVHGIEDAADFSGQFRIESLDFTDADEIGTDAYPQFGDWMQVAELRDSLETTADAVFVEVPEGLARELADAEVEVGDVFEVLNVEKTAGGKWDVTVSVDDAG